MIKIQSTKNTLSSKLSVLEEIFIKIKGFVLMCKSARLTLKPLGSSPQKGQVLRPLIPIK